ncbi:potassium/sodium hyperpolarization-activated cyclic nucleotide-gated channel 1-like [Wyeomyia smithii]|uniref:potassium/sodium hyperpolarization-activated cyclic nucleotide-gated channel 1-like n=1 Tax=Wyeomyia smithii TaxID=174621 RepID=UPI002467DDDE|nr:potassium/sodium hyperpolarization-activated cyclic nucleotide-gated channel 1-like [Wyeomyia smithii]
MSCVPEDHNCNLHREPGLLPLLTWTSLPPIDPKTPLWVRFKRRLRELMLLSPEHPDTGTYFKSFAQVANENKRLIENYPAWTIHPLSLFRKYWDLVMFVVSLVHLTLLSFVVSYLIYMDVAYFPAIIQFDVILCIILATEVVMKFFTGFVVEYSKEIVLEPGRIVWNYLKSFRVLYELLGVLPYIVLLYKFDECYYKSDQLFYLVSVICLYIIHIFRFREINRYFEVIPKFSQASANKIKVMNLIIATTYVLHWTSCIASIIPMLAFYSSSEEELPKWNDTEYLIGNFLVDMYWVRNREQAGAGYLVDRQRSMMTGGDFESFRQFLRSSKEVVARSMDYRFLLSKLDDTYRNETLLEQYLRSMMDTIQVALVSSHVETTGPQATHTIMTMYVVMAGWVWLTYILLEMIRIVIAHDLSETKYDEIVNELKAFSHRKKLGEESKDKILRHFFNRYKMRYFDEEAIQNTISNNLRRSIRMETCQHLVKNVELFRNLPHALIEEIVDRLKLEAFLENDVIIQADTFGDAMYFIASGTAAVYSVGGKELGHLTDGAHFGEISLLQKDQKRTASVIALEACEVYKLSYADFQLLIEPHSNLLRQMQKLADERLAKVQGVRDKVSEEEVYENFLQ